MPTRTRRNLKISDECSEYIDTIMEDNGLHYPAQAIEKILLEHKEMKAKEWNLDYVSKIFGETIHDLFSTELKKIRMAANHSDKTAQIILELMNTLMIDQKLDAAYLTDGDTFGESGSLRDAREAVENRIAEKRQKSLDQTKGSVES